MLNDMLLIRRRPAGDVYPDDPAEDVPCQLVSWLFVIPYRHPQSGSTDFDDQGDAGCSLPAIREGPLCVSQLEVHLLTSDFPRVRALDGSFVVVAR